MGDYWGLVVALAVGVPLLLLAGWTDARRARQEKEQLAAAPERGDDTVDAHTPAYITQDQIDALPTPGEGQRPGNRRTGQRFGWGMAHPDFATAGDAAEYEDVRVLVTDGEVEAFRQVLVAVSQATGDNPLVLVATAFHPEVLQTLAANRKLNQRPVLACVAPKDDLTRVAELTGAELLLPEDLRAGYTPTGTATGWISTRQATWVETSGEP